MDIYSKVILEGERNQIITNALVDTGAQISLIPRRIAAQIGAWKTKQRTEVVGVNSQSMILPNVVTEIYFPNLNNVGGKAAFVMSPTEPKIIVGMNILQPLGITIDTKTHKLYIKNEIWEAFKTVVGNGVLILGGIAIIGGIIEALGEQD